MDTDSDGIGNNADTDDDGDGVADGSDALPLDPNTHTLPTTAAQSLTLNLLPQTTNNLTGTLTSTSQDNRAVTYSIVTNGSTGTATVTDSSTGAFSYSTSAVSGQLTRLLIRLMTVLRTHRPQLSLYLLRLTPHKYQWHLDNTGKRILRRRRVPLERI